MTERSVETRVTRLEGSEQSSAYDRVVTEEPLEIRLVVGSATHTLAITMRTPGNDFELAAGFVTSEGIVSATTRIEQIDYCIDPKIEATQRYNIVNVRISPDASLNLDRFERHFTISSSCGICGRAQLDSLRDLGIEPIIDDTRVSAELLYQLPDRMRAAQKTFDRTGGLHAAALFSASDGTLQAVREDIGRHNAVDKIVGWASMEARLPLVGSVLLVSGRTSYEILQKAAVARIPLVCAISAPSSLAVELAQEFGITLIGFLRGERANMYTHDERVALDHLSQRR